MEDRENFKISGIICFIIAAINIIFYVGYDSLYLLLIRAALAVVSGVFIYQVTKKSTAQIKKDLKIFVIIGAIQFFMTNVIVGIITLVMYDKLRSSEEIKNGPPALEDEVDKETKKLDMLLKVGVSLVVLSGFVIATTKWNLIPDLAKTLLIVLLSFIFFGLSWLTGKVLNIKSSRNMYFFLGMIFLWFAYFSLGYYGIIANLFIKDSSNSLLFYSSCGFFAAILLYISNVIFKEEVLNLLCIITLITSLIILSGYFDLGIEIIVLLLNCIFASLVYIGKTDSIKKIALLVSYFIAGLFPFVIFDSHIVFIILNIIISLAVFLKPVSGNSYLIINSIFINYMVLYSVVTNNYSEIIDLYSISSIIIEVLYLGVIGLLLFFNKYDKKFREFNLGICSLIMMFVFLAVFRMDYVGGETYNFIANCANSFIILIASVLFFIKKRESYYVDYSLLLFIPIISIIAHTLIGVSFTNTVVILFTLYSIALCFLDTKYVKCFNLILLLSSLYLVYDEPSILGCVLLPLSSIVYYYSFNVDDIGFKTYLYVVMHIVLFITISTLLPAELSIHSDLYLELICTSIVFFVFILIGYLYRENKINYFLSLVIILIPSIKIIEILDMNNSISHILKSILGFYILFVICSKLLINPKDKKVLSIIGSSVILLFSVFSSDLYITLFAIIASLALIIFDILDDDYDGLYIVGISSITITLIYQLREVLLKVDLWLYILLIGLIIIGVVTYKQIKRK